jgi:histidinol-phosphatase (PHP family)
MLPPFSGYTEPPMNNYHTHTSRCKHASGKPVDYALAAKDGGSTILGMSDHTPLPDGRWLYVRMEMEELSSYEKDIEEAQAAVPEITILKGAECDWAEEYRAFYENELLAARNFDYLIGAVHWFPHRGDWISLWEIENASMLSSYARHISRAMESGLFAFIAHPDGFGAGYHRWDENAKLCIKDILEAAEETGTILEINGYGLRKQAVHSFGSVPRQPYPLDRFWEAAGTMKIKAICNSDAHKPSDVLASIPSAEEIAREFSVTLADPFLQKALEARSLQAAGFQKAGCP